MIGLNSTFNQSKKENNVKKNLNFNPFSPGKKAGILAGGKSWIFEDKIDKIWDFFFLAGEEEDKSKAAEGERRGVKRLRDEKDEHGRAYHEFREEAYNSRWEFQDFWEF